jgi:hypothetical protein
LNLGGQGQGEKQTKQHKKRVADTEKRDNARDRGRRVHTFKDRSVYENGGSGIFLKHTLSPVFW